MNKKLISFAAALAAAAMPMMAQEATSETKTVTTEDGIVYEVEEIYSTDKHRVITNHFKDNWFVSAAIGGQMYFGDHNRQLSFREWIAPAFDVSFGKWFSPEIGVRLMYSGGNLRGATQDGTHGLGSDIDSKPQHGYWLENYRHGYFHIHADVLFNANNIFAGYKEDRVWTISPYLGLGVMRAYRTPVATEFALNAGLWNAFRVHEAWDVNLDIRGTLVSDRFDGMEGGRTGEGLLTVTVGATYKFKERGWERPKTIKMTNRKQLEDLKDQVAKLNDQIDDLNDLCDSLRDDNDRLRHKVDSLLRRVNVASPLYVTFKIDKSDLSRRDRVALGMLADVIKSTDTTIVYTLSGYADAGTGTAPHNQALSERRCQAVFDCLVNEYGVDPERLEMDPRGGVENMFYDDPALSRAVITLSRTKTTEEYREGQYVEVEAAEGEVASTQE